MVYDFYHYLNSSMPMYSAMQMYPMSTRQNNVSLNNDAALLIRAKQRKDNVTTTVTIGAFALAIGTLIYSLKSGKNAEQAAKKSSGILQGFKNLFSGKFVKKGTEKVAEKGSQAAESVVLGSASASVEVVSAGKQATKQAKADGLWVKIKNMFSKGNAAKGAAKTEVVTSSASEASVAKVNSIYNAKNLGELETKDLRNILVNDTSIPTLPEKTKNISGLFRENSGEDVKFLLYENGKEKMKIYLRSDHANYYDSIEKGKNTLLFSDGQLCKLTKESRPNNGIFDAMNKKIKETSQFVTRSNDGYFYLDNGQKATNGFFKQKTLSGEIQLLKLDETGIIKAEYQAFLDHEPYLTSYGNSVISCGSKPFPRVHTFNLLSDKFRGQLDKFKF